MFTSSASVVAMPCGHYMHKTCYSSYMRVAYKCPICKKSAVNMEASWRKLDQAVDAQPMPPQFADTRAVVHCNDCLARSSVAYHWLGCKCAMCDSYNTNEVQILSTEDLQQEVENMRRVEALAAERQQQQQVRRLSAMPVGLPLLEHPNYFLRVPEAETHGRSLSTGSIAGLGSFAAGSFSPYEMLQRMSRSLSPIRRYLANEEGADGSEAVETDDELDFWGADGRFLSGDEDDTDDDDDDEEGSESEDSDDDDDEDEEARDEDDGNESDREHFLELVGHR